VTIASNYIAKYALNTTLHSPSAKLQKTLNIREQAQKANDFVTEIRDGILMEVLKTGGEFTFKKYLGNKIGLEAHEIIGPEKDPEYYKSKFGSEEEYDLVQGDPVIQLDEANFEQ
jgi:hypothetical protein